MNASDVLRAKGNALFTVAPDASLWSAVQTMAEFDVGSVVVMEHGRLAGMLTFREVFHCASPYGGETQSVSAIRASPSPR